MNETADNKEIEELEEVPALSEAPINLKKMSDSEMRGTKITTTNANTITKTMLNREGKILIKIPSNKEEKTPVSVGINGYVYLIKRDSWAEVPLSVVAVLENAKITMVTTDLENKKGDRAEIILEEVQRFAFQTKPVEPKIPSKPEEPATPAELVK
jgi:hypothetical protein